MTAQDHGTDEQVTPLALTCFVIGPIGNRLAEDGSEERETYEESLRIMAEVIEPACARNGLVPVRADALARAGEITEQIFRRLRDDDVVVADLTGANANVMYELGLRHTRQKLTVQIGEYRRLPFDVNTIRTIQFSRSRIGLIDARDELTRMLAAGLAGDYDPVSATRVWTEGDEPTDSGVIEQDGGEPAAREHATALGDERGLVDIIAESEEQQEPLRLSLEEVTACMHELTELAEKATAQAARSDAAGKGMRGRLQVLTAYGTGLTSIAAKVDSAVDKYVSALRSVSDGTLAIIGRMEEDPNELEAGRDFGLEVRRLAAITRDSMAASSGMVDAIRQNADLSRVVRDPSRRLAAALDRLAEATSTIDEWDRRLQSLGVPIPPDGWEPHVGQSPTIDGTDGSATVDQPDQDEPR